MSDQLTRLYPEIPDQPIHQVCRVYNDDTVTQMPKRRTEELDDCISYGTTMRFGCALFIDGLCVWTGYLGLERCRAWEQKFAAAAVTQVTEEQR